MSTKVASTTSPRFWIATSGESVCTDCGGGYLRSAVQADPNAFHHITPLHDWLEFTKDDVNDLRCEHCGVTPG